MTVKEAKEQLLEIHGHFHSVIEHLDNSGMKAEDAAFWMRGVAYGVRRCLGVVEQISGVNVVKQIDDVNEVKEDEPRDYA